MGKHYKDFNEFRDEMLAKHPEVRHEYDRLRARRMAIGRLKEIRMKKGLTQAELAALMDVRQHVVSRLESGRISPRLETLARAGNALGYDLEVRFKRRRKRRVVA